MTDPVEMLRALIAAAERAMRDEGVGTATRQRVLNRLLYGNPNGPELSDAEAEEVLLRSREQEEESYRRWQQAGGTGEHPGTVEPGASQPWFDAAGREVRPGPVIRDWYPLVSTCRCGRMITSAEPGGPWQHSD